MVRMRTKRGGYMKKISVMMDLKRINGKMHKALSNSLKEYDIDITPVQGRILLFIDENSNVSATDILERFNSINKYFSLTCMT